MMQSKIIGLTGNTGSGKSTVARLAAEMGGCIIDADKIAHDIIKRGKKAYNEIIDYFGEEIIGSDEEIDRKKLGEIVFGNERELERLNEITHKYIVDEIKRETESRKREGKCCIIIDAPLLVETGLNKYCDEIWVTWAREEIRIDRIMKRDGITRENALARISRQTDFEKLKKYADLIIENNEECIEDIKELICGKLEGDSR